MRTIEEQIHLLDLEINYNGSQSEYHQKRGEMTMYYHHHELYLKLQRDRAKLVAKRDADNIEDDYF